MEKHELTVDGERNLEFSGEVIATASRLDHGNSEKNRFWEYTLYRTEGGTLIALKEYTSRWIDECSQSLAKVCVDESEVIDYFGYCDLAKEIYSDANICATEKIE